MRYEVVFALQINIKVSYKLISRLCTSNVSYKVVLSLLMGSHNYTSYNYNALFTRNVTYTAASFILLCLLLTCFHFSKLLFFSLLCLALSDGSPFSSLYFSIIVESEVLRGQITKILMGPV